MSTNWESSGWFASLPVCVGQRTRYPELGRRSRVTGIMVVSFEDEGGHGFTPPERAVLYWKKAANAYRQACGAESPEAKKLYMQIAMAWATLADEMERAPLPARLVRDHYVKH